MIRHNKFQTLPSAPLSEPSSARLAAEAAFAPLASTPSASPAAVVVKRKRQLVMPDQEALALESTQESSFEAARGPRVFRVESPIVTSAIDKPSEGHPPLVRYSAENPDGVGSDRSNQSGRRVRKRRRAAPSPVTVILPAASDTGPGNDQDVASRPEEASAEGASPENLSFTRLPTRKTSHVASMTADKSGSRYLAVMAEIAELRREAEVARKAEAAEAIRWIKRAMAKYGLSRHDLAL
jgi:hypothetical protein